MLKSGERSRQDFKDFCGLWVGRCRKGFGESQGASPGEACVQVTNLPALLQVLGETAQLGMGRPRWGAGDVRSPRAPLPEGGGHKQRLIYSSLYLAVLMSKQIPTQFPCHFSNHQIGHHYSRITVEGKCSHIQCSEERGL